MFIAKPGQAKQNQKLFILNSYWLCEQLYSQFTGRHFNQPGHILANVQILALEHIKKNSDLYRKEREEYTIRKFNIVMKGLNRKYWRQVNKRWGGF